MENPPDSLMENANELYTAELTRTPEASCKLGLKKKKQKTKETEYEEEEEEKGESWCPEKTSATRRFHPVASREHCETFLKSRACPCRLGVPFTSFT